MTWQEKVERIRAETGRTYAHMEREGGINEGTLNTAISRGSMLMADTGIKLAKSLNVPAEWLFDDLTGWPPPWIGGVPFPVRGPADQSGEPAPGEGNPRGQRKADNVRRRK